MRSNTPFTAEDRKWVDQLLATRPAYPLEPVLLTLLPQQRAALEHLLEAHESLAEHLAAINEDERYGRDL